MKQKTSPSSVCQNLALGLTLLMFTLAVNNSAGYQYYSNPVDGTGYCSECHGDFRGTTSTKGTIFPAGSNHEMHRGSGSTAMGTACNLCHSGTSRFPVQIKVSTGTTNNTGIGCTGCHMPLGLRKHHKVNGVTVCGTCHLNDGAPPPETTKPPYYGTADTKVQNPENAVLANYTNENWSLMLIQGVQAPDYLGVDNDGNNLYDLADYAVGPFKILGTAKEGNDLRVTFQTAGGRTNTVQSAGLVNGPYTNLSGLMGIPGVGVVTTNFLHVGGAANGSRYYRLTGQLP